MIKVINGDCLEMLDAGLDEMRVGGVAPIIVTDPPFNIGYHYKSYHDRMPETEYYQWLAKISSQAPSVFVLYPEAMHKLSMAKGESPIKVVSWVYNSNTAKQHRDIGFYGVSPDFRKVKQPYKNLNDKRIKKLIEQGKSGARLYDWWNVNQVKNVNKDKTSHPCQMPVEVMEKIIGILPDKIGVIDPFCGSGTTGVACKKLGIPFIGIEIDAEYCSIAEERLIRA